MEKSVYWWVGLAVACTFGGFMAFYIKEILPFLFSVFLLITYGVCCALDQDSKSV